MAKKIMLVDDSQIARLTARATLEQAGYEVVELENQKRFTAALTRERPDLVLMDVLMPGRTGDEVTTMATRFAVHKCPIVLYSSKGARELAKLAASSGAAGYIEKSISNQAFLAKLRQYIA